jgi:hypothetical protein
MPKAACIHSADPGCADGIGYGTNMTFQRTCPDGSVQTATLPAGSYLASGV